MTALDPVEAFGAQSAIRTLRLLRLLGDAGTEGASLAALVRQSGLSKPTCRRLLIALMEEGMAVQDTATRLYFLGREIYLLGMVAADRYGIHRVALDSVARLAQRTGDAAFLQVRHGEEVVCLAREDGTFPLRSHVLKAGDRHLLGAGAGPLAILAALPEAEAEAYLAGHARPLAERYPPLVPLLPDLLRETRERRYSLNRGILFPGSWGMAMAIRGPSGRIEACLSLAAVESRMQPDREPELAALLAAEVQLVEQRLARAPGPPTPLTSPPRRRTMA
ncbi:helix-turn-helix domain-containing protein [Rhabdaerophilum sp. SD176]|uniref:IclR family transcriptional regulator n=1 Tax=Rhabdaerophilum sp. SD176 TaxID=2983548 RepID=UPI0024DFAC53|nr:helix-turn-helix domain-containing protein [Rhabdaerophilum sp. SD176]